MLLSLQGLCENSKSSDYAWRPNLKLKGWKTSLVSETVGGEFGPIPSHVSQDFGDKNHQTFEKSQVTFDFDTFWTLEVVFVKHFETCQFFGFNGGLPRG